MGQAGLIGAAILLKPSLSSAKGINKVGLQLYTLRDYLPKDVKGVIGKVAAAGYKEVETFGYNKQNGFWGLDAKAFSDLLKANGLTSPSGHSSVDVGAADYSASLQEAIDAAHIVGQQYVILPWLNSNLIDTADKCKAISEKLNKIGETVNKAGLKFAYHNHNFEWAPVDGTTFYDVVLKETDPNLVKLEMDIYWVVRAGIDAAAMLEAHPGRFELFHIKDADKANPNLNTEVGKGTVDFQSILNKAKKAGVKHFLVEQENFINIDPYVSITESCNYVKNKLTI